VIDKRFEELKLTGNLPSPSGVGLALLQVTQREDVSMEDVTAVVQADPTLTGRILKLANSGEATGVHPATTVRAAAMRLGLRAVRNIGLSFSLLAANRTGRCERFEYEEFWSHSLAVAVSGQILAELRRDVPPGEAFTCGLLSGIGRLALASIHPQIYGGVLERARGQPSQRLAEIEQECFGTNHRELAAAMLRDWGLPEHYSAAVAIVGGGGDIDGLESAEARKLAAALQAARDLARALVLKVDAAPEACARALRDLEGMRQNIQMDPQGLESLWTRVVESWRAWGDTMRIRAQPALTLADLRQRAESGSASPGTEPSSAPGSAAGVADPEEGLRVLLVGLPAREETELRGLLESDGHRVLSAADKKGGLAQALEHATHIVVSDGETDQGTGLDLVRALRQSEAGSHMHCLLIAGAGQESRLLEAFEQGVDEYVLRPFDPRALRARVRAAQRVVRLARRVETLLKEREVQLGQLAILTRKLQLAAVTDALTGLFNRRYAMERLQQEASAALGSKQPLSVIGIDIDRFKSVNDGFGHDVGDAVLRASAHLLRNSLRRGDTACRMGGEEFLVICPGASLSAAQGIAERLCSSARAHVIESGSFRRAVTLSLGVAELDRDRPEIEALLKHADERVYIAKESGRDRVVAEDRPPAVRRAG